MEKYKFQKGMKRRELIDFRIGRYQNKEWKLTQESLFASEVEKHLEQIFSDLGRPIKTISREFSILGGRLDFLLNHEDETFTLVEVKYSRGNSHDEAKCCYSVGQLLTYKATFCRMYDVPKEEVNLMIINNEEFISVVDVVAFNDLPIEYLVIGENGVKYYGK